MPPYRAVTAALGAGAAIGLFAGAGCSTQDCKNMRANGSPFASLLCGGEGIDAPQPNTPPLSLCQPREVMPVFFSLIDQNDPSLAGLRSAVADLGRPVCLVPKDRTCTSDDQCAVGHCVSGLCPCQTSYSPLTDVLGISLRAMATIATDPRETTDPKVPPPGCLSATAAENGESEVGLTRVEDALQRRAVLYDKQGDRHYDYASAWIKATRGSDPDASLYYLAVMLEGGEDPRFIVRRMVVLASEDIGNADPQALVVATAAASAVEHVGLPECQFALAQAAVYLSLAPKSDAVKRAVFAAREWWP